jgi:hypothetical protein
LLFHGKCSFRVFKIAFHDVAARNTTLVNVSVNWSRSSGENVYNFLTAFQNGNIEVSMIGIFAFEMYSNKAISFREMAAIKYGRKNWKGKVVYVRRREKIGRN